MSQRQRSTQEWWRSIASRRSLVTLLVAALCVVGGLSYLLFTALPGASVASGATAASSLAGAQTVGKGITDYRLENASVPLATIPAIVAEMGPGRLGAQWTRLLVHWSTLQPTSSGAYNQTYVQQLDAITSQLHAAGIQIIMTMTDVPKWASNQALWKAPPLSFRKGVYQPFYAMKVGSPAVLGAYSGAAQFLASHFKATVQHFECWNEPNLGGYLYPQRTATNANYGPATYLTMLRAFHKGVKAGNSSATVIAGATSPRGTNNAYSTSPLTFALYLKNHQAALSFDAYSHHPYTPGGTRTPAPNQPPNNPARAVTLYNLSQLTSIFPSKPFYLTEYGYGTHYSQLFGYAVSQATQAKYMREAYAMVAKNHQVKALLWFLVTDWGPNAKHPYDGTGAYTGVSLVNGTRKLSWYVFAGGNSLSLQAPASVRSAAALKLSGVLTTKVGPLKGQTLLLQSRKPSSSAWTAAASTVTGSGGTYTFSRKQTATRVYRVVWNGVTQSATRTVRTP